MPEEIQRGNAEVSLTRNVIAFCRLLRSKGLQVGPAEETDVMQALENIELGDHDQFRLSLRTILCSSRKDQKIFDHLYWPFWEGGRTTTVTIHDEGGFLQGKRSAVASLWSWSSVRDTQQKAEGGYSPMESLNRKEFADYPDNDVVDAMKLVRAMARLLSTRPSRRFRSTQKHQLLDFRKTIRLSLRNGEVLDLAFRQRAPRPLKLVVLCDVSGSMESYTRLLLTFLYALQQAYTGVEIFVFSTALRRVTTLLKAETLSKALRQISDAVPEWSGGTRIGQSLLQFAEDYGARLLNSDTVVLILSDGWDVGDVELMDRSLSEIHKKARDVVWLNPLQNDSNYEPVCAGMQAAMPYLDALLPAHNLDSLWTLYHWLASRSMRLCG